MKKIVLFPGLEITDVALGLGSLGVHGRAEECGRVIDRYLELGGNIVDTARMYEGGETDQALGAYLKSRGNRHRLLLCTKGAYPSTRLSPGDIRGDLEETLLALGTDYADLYILHRDDVKRPVEEIMPTLAQLVKEGKTRAVGASNWTAGRIAQANAFAAQNGMPPFVVSQILFSLARTTPAQTGDLTHIAMNDVEYSWYEETGFPVIAYSSQAKGYFSRYAAGEAQKPGPQRYFGFLPDNERRAKRLMELAKSLGSNVGALALAYVRQSGLRAAGLVAFSRLEQLEETMEALDITLSPSQIHWLETGEGGR